MHHENLAGRHPSQRDAIIRKNAQPGSGTPPGDRRCPRRIGEGGNMKTGTAPAQRFEGDVGRTRPKPVTGAKPYRLATRNATKLDDAELKQLLSTMLVIRA